MKKLITFLLIIGTVSMVHYFQVNAQFRPFQTYQGGTGTTSTPSYNQILIGANGTEVYNVTSVPNCTGSNKLLFTSSTQVFSCATDETGAAGGGSVSTSSAITVDNFPFWVTVGGQLAGTSTLTINGTTVNNSGTITMSGVALSTSTGANPTAS